MNAYPVALRLGLLALLAYVCPVSAQTATPAAVTDPASALLSRATPLARRTVALGEHRITLVRIRTPHLPVLPPAPVRPPTAEELATEARQATKLQVFASFMATIYPGPVTEIVWQDGARTFRAYSSIDFRFLQGLSQIETDTVVASWFCVPMEGDETGLSVKLRARLGLDLLHAGYLVDATAEEMEAAPEAFAVLDAIQDYYEANHRQLAAAYWKTQAENEARESDLLAHPPVRPDTTVYVWKPAN